MIKEAHFFNELRECNLSVNATLVLLALAAGKCTTTLIKEAFDFAPNTSHYWLLKLVASGLAVKVSYTPLPGQYKRVFGYELTPKGLRIATVLKEHLTKIALDATTNS